MIQKLSEASPLVRMLATLGSFAASIIVFTLLTWSLAFAVIIVGSAAVHELCHWFVFRRHGVKSGIVFLGIAAVTYPIGIGEGQQALELVFKTFWVHPAGIIGNLALGMMSLGLGNLADFWYVIAWINFLLALLNLAPTGGLDGAKIVIAITHFFKEEREEKAVWIVTITEGLALFGTLQFMKMGIIPQFIGIILLIFFGLDLFPRLFSNQYKGKLSPREGGFNKKEALDWAAVYLSLVVASLVGLFLIPTQI